jgi:hypothetical protein
MKSNWYSKINATEHEEQKVVAEYLDMTGVLWYAVPNGSLRNVVVAKKLKAEGVKPGVPDIVIAEPSGGYHGLYVELKRKKGGCISGNQKKWIDKLGSRGYLAVVCRGADEAISVIDNYFSGRV